MLSRTPTALVPTISDPDRALTDLLTTPVVTICACLALIVVWTFLRHKLDLATCARLTLVVFCVLLCLIAAVGVGYQWGHQDATASTTTDQ